MQIAFCSQIDSERQSLSPRTTWLLGGRTVEARTAAIEHSSRQPAQFTKSFRETQGLNLNCASLNEFQSAFEAADDGPKFWPTLGKSLLIA